MEMENDRTPSKQNSGASGAKKMTVTLPERTAEMLNMLSSLQSVTLNEAVRRAISTEALIQREVQRNSKIIIEDSQGERKELVFR
jgi:hypothetical protein